MGTEIRLIVGDVSLAYAKNNMGYDFGFLFQEADLYDCCSEDSNEDADVEGSEFGFVRPLLRVLPRLRVLGHTLEAARAEYQATLEDPISLPGSVDPAEVLTFEEFCLLANLYPLASLATEYIASDTKEREVVAQGRFAAHAREFSRLPWADNSDWYWSESSYLSDKICILSPPSMLQIFGLNPENADAEVIWEFGPIVDAGWVDRDAFRAGTHRAQTILIATEGASDAAILRRALDVLRPDVADFFRFIDGDERHHFWGTGNLVKFAEGLLRIDIQNQVLFLFDNDAEGVDAYRKLQALKMPGNMRSMLLPDIDELRSFMALGPEGLNTCDINGRAAAIECYLDLSLNGYPPARVIWSNYKKDVDAWHGALEHKESYMRHFMKQDAVSLTMGTYDTSKLVRLLDAMITEASRLH
jgi:hypothetical protein